MMPLLFLFIAIPFLEMLVLIKMGETFGFWTTLLFVLGAGFAGAYLAKLEGLRTWWNIQSELAAGRMPAEQMLDGAVILAAGILLMTPGMLTDVLGLLLLLPWTRSLVKYWLKKEFSGHMRKATFSNGEERVIEINPEEGEEE